MKFLLLMVFLISALTCAYFMVTFVRQLKASLQKQEPPPIGLLAMVLTFVIIMLAEASAAITILIHIQ